MALTPDAKRPAPIWHGPCPTASCRRVTALLVTFVAVRAVGLHHVDALIARYFGPARMNWILELSGLVLVTINAALAGTGLRLPPLRRRAPR